jgi:hypothetical protein
MGEAEGKRERYIYMRRKSNRGNQRRSKSLKMASPYCQFRPTNPGAKFLGFSVTKKSPASYFSSPSACPPCICVSPPSPLPPLFCFQPKNKEKETRGTALKTPKRDKNIQICHFVSQVRKM